MGHVAEEEVAEVEAEEVMEEVVDEVMPWPLTGALVVLDRGVLLPCSLPDAMPEECAI